MAWSSRPERRVIVVLAFIVRFAGHQQARGLQETTVGFRSEGSGSPTIMASGHLQACSGDVNRNRRVHDPRRIILRP